MSLLRLRKRKIGYLSITLFLCHLVGTSIGFRNCVGIFLVYSYDQMIVSLWSSLKFTILTSNSAPVMFKGLVCNRALGRWELRNSSSTVECCCCPRSLHLEQATRILKCSVFDCSL